MTSDCRPGNALKHFTTLWHMTKREISGIWESAQSSFFSALMRWPSSLGLIERYNLVDAIAFHFIPVLMPMLVAHPILHRCLSAIFVPAKQRLGAGQLLQLADSLDGRRTPIAIKSPGKSLLDHTA